MLVEVLDHNTVKRDQVLGLCSFDLGSLVSRGQLELNLKD